MPSLLWAHFTPLCSDVWARYTQKRTVCSTRCLCEKKKKKETVGYGKLSASSLHSSKPPRLAMPWLVWLSPNSFALFKERKYQFKVALHVFNLQSQSMYSSEYTRKNLQYSQLKRLHEIYIISQWCAKREKPTRTFLVKKTKQIIKKKPLWAPIRWSAPWKNMLYSPSSYWLFLNYLDGHWKGKTVTIKS